MNEWCEYLDDIENNPVYIEKMRLDNDEEDSGQHISTRKHRKDCSWIRNRKFKKKLVRRFLSQNPGMDLSKVGGIAVKSAWYVGNQREHVYSINPYAHVYKSRSGALRILHGKLIDLNACGFQLSSRRSFKVITRETNRKIRRLPINEDTPDRFSYYKKYVEARW